ncbi:hypothetical protein [Caballeronia sp. dw_276]|uniref:hypothetical protein n=1 Tax=Caballeronia sp. dw_276 TaxID=2719795 RepID=UPI001BD1C889|nr:hypothetical protein [Caballeronia sp. dw_276]
MSKPRRVEHRTVMEGTDTDLAMLKLALFAHAERIGLDAPPMPIGGWPQLP